MFALSCGIIAHLYISQKEEDDGEEKEQKGPFRTTVQLILGNNLSFEAK